MAAEVTFHFKHPYIIALVRWCVSSFWSSATVLLHRLITAPVPITAAKPPKPRPANYDHLHPEPLVECSVLHTPDDPEVDVIFVHGLYGSLANTWRQGEWGSRYDNEITKVALRRPHATQTCRCTDERMTCDGETHANELETNETRTNEDDLNMNEGDVNMNEGNMNMNEGDVNITNDDIFITEKFYTHQVEIMNYDTQAQFVKDLFEVANEVKPSDCKCEAKCEVGCGCVCDKCYSPCWPRDWVKVDYPGARVISINYTSDPYLWRPLWVKPSQRLRLHERAAQMISQLLGLGVGQRPIIWVGHSKGGLFIKQIYCEAHNAYLNEKRSGETEINMNGHGTNECTNDNRINHVRDKHTDKTDCDRIYSDGETNETDQNEVKYNIDNEYIDNDLNGNIQTFDDTDAVSGLSSLYRSSAGFMFYSVPHRGSPLADIKTPVTARSVELMEICKDCPLVLGLHERWSRASASLPAVRSLVETDRTLMSVLYLRIVSVDSADPGIGSLHGVSVDHREICKPSSRRCILYQELMTLMGAALQKYNK